jgi:hypothetical protein
MDVGTGREPTEGVENVESPLSTELASLVGPDFRPVVPENQTTLTFDSFAYQSAIARPNVLLETNATSELRRSLIRDQSRMWKTGTPSWTHSGFRTRACWPSLPYRNTATIFSSSWAHFFGNDTLSFCVGHDLEQLEKTRLFRIAGEDSVELPGGAKAAAIETNVEMSTEPTEKLEYSAPKSKRPRDLIRSLDVQSAVIAARQFFPCWTVIGNADMDPTKGHARITRQKLLASVAFAFGALESGGEALFAFPTPEREHTAQILAAVVCSFERVTVSVSVPCTSLLVHAQNFKSPPGMYRRLLETLDRRRTILGCPKRFYQQVVECNTMWTAALRANRPARKTWADTPFDNVVSTRIESVHLFSWDVTAVSNPRKLADPFYVVESAIGEPPSLQSFEHAMVPEIGAVGFLLPDGHFVPCLGEAAFEHKEVYWKDRGTGMKLLKVFGEILPARKQALVYWAMSDTGRSPTIHVLSVWSDSERPRVGPDPSVRFVDLRLRWALFQNSPVYNSNQAFLRFDGNKVSHFAPGKPNYTRRTEFGSNPHISIVNNRLTMDYFSQSKSDWPTGESLSANVSSTDSATNIITRCDFYGASHPFVYILSLPS